MLDRVGRILPVTAAILGERQISPVMPSGRREYVLGQGDRPPGIAERRIGAVGQEADDLPVAGRFIGPASRDVFHGCFRLDELAPGLFGVTNPVE